MTCTTPVSFRGSWALALVAGLLLLSASTGCGSEPATDPDRRGRPDRAAPLPDQPVGPDGDADSGDRPDAEPAGPFRVRESVEQLHVTHAPAGVELVLHASSGAEVQRGVADDLGSLIFRKVPPGQGYVIRAAGVGEVGPLRVYSIEESQPPRSFYSSQRLGAGYQYITTRDGTTLSAYVTLPGPIENGPYPTVVNYSGYSPSRPGEPLGEFGGLCDELPVLCDAPSDGGSVIAALLGYATVNVNIRGTGCSGGAYDFFETLQQLDGYDVIETVAAQPWVLHNKVGMVGLSYPGITQLFVASVRPPSLAAITPLSVIGNPATTLLPGGILNDGFALAWITNVLSKAAPYGQGWERSRVEAGDVVCAENQLLHGQRLDNVQQATNTPYYVPELVDPLNPTLFVDRIQVPVFFASAFQDEQTGPFFTTLLDRFTGSPLVRITVYNGVHVDGFAPQVLAEWKAFLDLHVARRKPSIPQLVRDLAPVLFSEIFGSPLPIPDDRFAGFQGYEDTLAAYQSEPQVRVIFENGGTADAGAPIGTFDRFFAAWPVPGTEVRRLFLQPDGSLAATEPGEPEGASQFLLDPEAGGRGIIAGGHVWDKLPTYDWPDPGPGRAVSWVSEPLTEDLVMIGTASADLYLRSSVDDADLEATLSEVRPDGQEMYVQSGWLRASQRAVGPGSTELFPYLTQLEKDVTPLVPGEWTPVRVPIAAFAHVFRAGSRIRLSVDTPGESRADWRFRLKTFAGPAVHQIAHSAALPSSVALPLVPGVEVPTMLPACPSLRGQQCRTYTPYVNDPAVDEMP